MKKKQVGIWLVIVGSITASYTACSKFQTLDSVSNISSTNNLGSSTPDDQNNDPMTSPMPSPLPMEMPSPLRPAGPIKCPNRPASAVTVLETSFNTADGEGQLWEVYPGAGKILQPTGAPGSAPYASASILPAGQSIGGQQTIWPKIGKEQPLTNLYMCMVWKMNKDFVGIRTNNKLVFLAAQDFTFGRQGMNGLLSVPGRDGYPPNSFQMSFGHNSGNLDNSHVCKADLGLICPPNVKDTPLYTDTWYTVEAYVIASTCPTCRNGTVKWWIDGVLQGNYTNLNYGDGIVNEWQINHTWDNGADKQCGPPTNPTNTIGRDCRKDQIHYFDHVILAAVGGRAPENK